MKLKTTKLAFFSALILVASFIFPSCKDKEDTTQTLNDCYLNEFKEDPTWIKIQYTSDNKLSLLEFLSQGGAASRGLKYTYDLNGNIIQIVDSFYGASKQKNKYTYEYSANQITISHAFRDIGSGYVAINDYKFTYSATQMIKTVETFAAGSSTASSSMNYQDNGKNLTNYSTDGITFKAYSYDANKNPLKGILFVPDPDASYFNSNNITYDSKTGINYSITYNDKNLPTERTGGSSTLVTYGYLCK